MSIHKEIHLEDEICGELVAAGWLSNPGDNIRYDRGLALFPEDVVAWVETTQPKAWDAIKANHGSNAAKVLIERLRKALDAQGLLEVLRQGFDMLGLRKPITMCQFKPARSEEHTSELQSPC